MKKQLLWLCMLCIGAKPLNAQLSQCAVMDYIKASNTGSNDQFGQVLALSGDGNTLAVGAAFEDGSGTGINPASNNSASNSGAVYVYTRSSASAVWTFQAYIKAANAGSDDNFGAALALSNDGNTLVVGAAGEDGSGSGVNPGSNNGSSNAGAAYVFFRTGSSWAQQAYIKASNTGSTDGFGSAVSISADGNTMVAGAWSEDGNGTGINPGNNNGSSGSGAVYVYVRSGSTWSFQAYIKASNTGNGDQFGYRIGLSSNGNTLAVSANREGGDGTGIDPASNNNITNGGAVYLYSRSGTTWSFNHYVKASNTGDGDFFGSALSLSADGNTLAVGAYYEQGSGVGINPSNDNLATAAGAVYVYSRSAGVWAFQAYLKAPNSQASDFFGWDVALSADGNALVAGAYGEDGGGTGVNAAFSETAILSGAAYTYTRSGSTWIYRHYLKTRNSESLDAAGYSVGMSANGQSIAVGAVFEYGSGTGVNPADNNSAANAGAVYVYTDADATQAVLAAYNASTNGNICDDGAFVYLRDPGDASWRNVIARIDKNGNSFTVSSAVVDALTSGTYVNSNGGQTGELKPRMLTVSTSPASGLTVNGGPIVRMYYSTAETFTAVGMNPIEQWLKHPGSKAAMLGDLTYNGVHNSTELTPVATGTEDGVAYADFQVTSFSTFAQFGYIGVLPLQLLSFSATAQGPLMVRLRWETADSKGVQLFVLERSANGRVYEEVYRVPVAAVRGGGQEVYAYTDALPAAGNWYYRIRQVMQDGSVDVSPVAKVQVTDKGLSVGVFPNPFSHAITLRSLPAGMLGKTARVMDVRGKLVASIVLTGGQQQLTLSGLAKGVYYLQLPDGSVLKLLKQ